MKISSVRIEPLKIWHGVIFIWIYYFIIRFKFSFSIYLVHALYIMSIWHDIFFALYIRCIKGCMRDPSHGFFVSIWFVHNWVMNLGDPFEVIVHYLLNGEIIDLGY